MKKASKTKKKKFELSLSPKVVIPSLIAITILVFFVFPRIIDYVKFMTLKNDMLALQKEFNEIDPGWEYSESCHANGQKFRENEASSCYINLSIKKHIDISKYNNISLLKQTTKINKEYTLDDYDRKSYQVDMQYKMFNSVGCGFSVPIQKGSAVEESTFGCHDSALNFYFPKSQ